MRASLLIAAGLASAAIAAAPAAGADPHAVAAAPPGTVRVLECSPAPDSALRSVTFEARMRPARRSVTMALRFTLQARAAGERWRRVAAEGFDAWLTSEPSVRRFVYDRTVRNLAAPASYRAVVRFRWLDEDGAVVAAARAVSAPCSQPDLRPDLEPRRLDVQPVADPDLRRYAVLIRNAGEGAAEASTLRLDAAGRALSAAVPALAPGEARVVALTAPACAPGSAVAATADAGGVVDEADEDDNAVTATCPP
jgi:hypothetical protein